VRIKEVGACAQGIVREANEGFRGVIAGPIGNAAAGIDEIEETLRVITLEEVDAADDDVRAELEGVRTMVPAESV
jgi:hypothetical protein